MPPCLGWTRAAVSWPRFSSFSTQNLKCQSTWKLCPSTNWITFILVNFEVFRWNLENAAEVPKDIHRRQGLSGVWPCFWPRVDDKGVLTSQGGQYGLLARFSRWWPRLT
jgi:hypothetical protein